MYLLRTSYLSCKIFQIMDLADSMLVVMNKFLNPQEFLPTQVQLKQWFSTAPEAHAAWPLKRVPQAALS